ncbi:N-acetylglutaminylglutamine synthetase [Novosphingobium album (ex Hu et al. 2023)]|uniref:N-acetylglutaminylglutamine synthetase n=1 Tax=Novosphingobium album (ex Hu et al. 2023) TaxID=2930093 RepID=A0ABT0B3L6_9SPHN|nr:N-acetylglutaminylglutamine synthetase [Novosphingobium album (ex Hu et al. 2023)]MCJ2179563.1 N-acetylglutaminylglutamine synthetase [Novosphingobium album (ex Hu et al. 2023)]
MHDQAVLPHRAATENAVAECGWGRIIFGNSFAEVSDFAEALREEQANCRDIAIYVTNPHVLLATAPQELFLDPSHTYRLMREDYEEQPLPSGITIRTIRPGSDVEAVNRIFAARNMVVIRPEFFDDNLEARGLHWLVAEDPQTGDILGAVMGVDHTFYTGPDDGGSSLWCLAADPQARQAGIGKALTRTLAEHFWSLGREYMDLTVMHDNEAAISLYEKLGFRRIQSFTVKRKNTFNEKLFTGPEQGAELNPYARIIVDEARRRGIHVEIIDAEGGLFRLSLGGRMVVCRESLSEFTSAVAMSICDNKEISRRVVAEAGVKVPDQVGWDGTREQIEDFLARNGSVVVKPVRGEQGTGISVDLRTVEEIETAIATAQRMSSAVLLEQYFEGQDLRLVVINFRLVAAAIRKPAAVTGDGSSTIAELIDAQSRRRMAATGGESRIPIDAETKRIVRAAGYDMDAILPEGVELLVRKTANLHTGGTIHDVTDAVHPELVQAAINVAKAIDIPVVGVDFMVRSPSFADYVFIEANERPGLANHEPQPTAQRFVDLLFPLSLPAEARVQRSGRRSSEHKT